MSAAERLENRLVGDPSLAVVNELSRILDYIRINPIPRGLENDIKFVTGYQVKMLSDLGVIQGDSFDSNQLNLYGHVIRACYDFVNSTEDSQ